VQTVSLLCASFFVVLAAMDAAGAGEAWVLDRQVGDKGQTCSLSRMDRGRRFSLTLAPSDNATDQVVVGLAFDEPKLIQGAQKALATLEFDNGTSESHRIGLTPDGVLLVPIVTEDLQDILRTFSESKKLTVATRFGSTSFGLDGLGARIPALRDCAGG
jgi:hypothetical protein